MRCVRLRATVVVAAIAAAAVGVTPVQADPINVDDGWVLIDGGVIAGSGLDNGPIVHAEIGREILADKGRRKPCKPKTVTVTPMHLRWERYENQYTRAIGFKWFGPGSASVSNDCASRLDLTVQVTDYAPSSDPVVAGDPTSAWDGTASNGLYSAATEATNFVVYYDPLNAYVRGTSTVVEIKVSATYHNSKADATLPLRCRMTHTTITPTPTGPIVGETTPPQDCAS